MIEPASCLTKRRYRMIVFVGPAQSSKTFHLIVLPILYCVMSSPRDIAIIEKNQIGMRRLKKLEIDSLINGTPALKNMIVSAQDDTSMDISFKNGVKVILGLPSRNQLAGMSVSWMLLTDYDRWPGDIGGEGGGAMQALQRIKVAGSAGKMVVESSPAMPITDPTWEPPGGNRHIAPPTDGGVFQLYNTGERRRLYGRCPECGEYMLPLDGPEAFSRDGKIPHLICTANGCGLPAGSELEAALKGDTLWVGDGQEIDHHNGVAVGDLIETDRASFWMSGVFAAFQTWGDLNNNYTAAYREYEETGNDNNLKNSVAADFAAAYIPQHIRESATPYSALMARAEAAEPNLVPPWARCLLAAVDIQKFSFEVLILGVGEGYEVQPIARFPLVNSPREGETVQPAQYLEDWELLTDRVVNATYRMPGSRLEMRIFRTIVDMHGVAGVTPNALEWWRRLDKRRNGGQNLRGRVFLSEGMGGNRATLVTLATPDARAQKGNTATRGDVPVLHLATNKLKDRVWADIQRENPGPRYIHWPDWLPEKYFKEVVSETRDKNGKWTNPPGRRNETFDQLYMARALWIQLGGDKVDLQNPPAWFILGDNNSEIMRPEDRQAMKSRTPKPRKRTFSRGVKL